MKCGNCDIILSDYNKTGYCSSFCEKKHKGVPEPVKPAVVKPKEIKIVVNKASRPIRVKVASAPVKSSVKKTKATRPYHKEGARVYKTFTDAFLKEILDKKKLYTSKELADMYGYKDGTIRTYLKYARKLVYGPTLKQ